MQRIENKEGGLKDAEKDLRGVGSYKKRTPSYQGKLGV